MECTRDKISDIEARLSARNISVAELCRQSGINQTTWVRWKRGETTPRAIVWNHVAATAEKLLTQALPDEAA